MRQEFTMEQEDLDALAEISRPSPLIMTHIIPPSNQQDQINKAWVRLGDKMGFDCSTVQMDGAQLKFTAVPK